MRLKRAQAITLKLCLNNKRCSFWFRQENMFPYQGLFVWRINYIWELGPIHFLFSSALNNMYFFYNCYLQHAIIHSMYQIFLFIIRWGSVFYDFLTQLSKIKRNILFCAYLRPKYTYPWKKDLEIMYFMCAVNQICSTTNSENTINNCNPLKTVHVM